ncbi:hypothetical protein OJAV_G00159220 [Oryzias javanicus]|uniref:Helicase ATP-binding domain-containing protein n=1 Tax=Oryzias javanicus TaxID=123683 RepID=A0A3S2LWD7_ORYJA|nr:hypothetical protein OJAV_G00159220 [Oryzias javanicus]
MRRSGAPSQLLGNAVKKPRFVSPSSSFQTQSKPLEPKPGLVNTLDKVQRSLSVAVESEISNVSAKSSLSNPGLSRALARVLSATESKENEADTKPVPGLKDLTEDENEGDGSSLELTHGSPQTPLPPGRSACFPGTAGPGIGCSQDGVRYFSVVWCKASKKKHKRWEGDAVLITRGRTVTLKDMEGKEIGKGSGYKVSELASLSEGETLMIGSKQVEVMGIVSSEDYAKGRCFQEVQTEQTESHAEAIAPPCHRPTSKPFTPPTMLGRGENPGPKSGGEQTYRPRYDPLAPGALVMPRPSTNHQWLHNKAALPVVEVVIDPHLTQYLRPHQRDGLLFLYECVMGLRVASRYGAILADEMGLGKTLQSVALSWTLLKQGPYGGKPVAKRVLVVTPGSLVQNWKAEFNKWLGRERICVFTVDQDHRIEQFVLSPLHSVLVISYEMLLRCLEQVQKVEFGLIICDEGHRLKNSSIKTSSALTSLSCDRRVILTGTPVQNDLQEFYAIIEFVIQEFLGPRLPIEKCMRNRFYAQDSRRAQRKREF